MTTPIVICDDSSFARKQMARSLPDNWAVDITFAANGEEALAAIKEGQADVLFLDLTMPVLDGYGVLEQIKSQDLPCMVIVVSGDIQPDAVTRVKRLGAMEFLKKPIDKERVKEVLTSFGVIGE